MVNNGKVTCKWYIMCTYYFINIFVYAQDERLESKKLVEYHDLFRLSCKEKHWKPLTGKDGNMQIIFNSAAAVPR
jgi:hypothetical protein